MTARWIIGVALALPILAFAQWSERWINPAVTDSAIDQWTDPHYVVIDTSRPSQGRLMVWLPGSFGQPKNYQLIVREAASMGLHAVGLRYPNTWTVDALCRNDADSTCHEKVRLEIFDGVDRSSKVNVSPANSIQNRLLKLLQYLHAHYPTEGWNAYFEADSVRWDRVVVAGHSQGGGHAAMIARLRRIDRCLMFGWVDIWQGTLAPWQSLPRRTPADAHYGITHEKDVAVPRLLLWQMWGMPGPPLTIDTSAPPYEGSHQLFTSITPARPGAYHGSVAVDRNTPLDSAGRPRLAPVWRYMIGDSTLSGWAPPFPAAPRVTAGRWFVRIELPASGRMQIEFFDIAGRRVAATASRFSSGVHHLRRPIALRRRPFMIRLSYQGRVWTYRFF